MSSPPGDEKIAAPDGNVVGNVEVLGPSCALGESPRWDGTGWWWIDAAAGTVYRLDGGRRAETTGDSGMSAPQVTTWATFGERVSAVQPLGRDRLVLARGHTVEIRRVDEPAVIERTLADFDLADGWLLNDGMLAPDGAFWIGVVAPDGRRDDGWLARISPDGVIRPAVEHVRMSNGIAFVESGRQVYHVDSLRRTVWRHDLDGSGAVVASSPFIELDATDGLPDGICLDGAGRLWVAVYGRGEVRCYTGGARPVATVTVAAPQSTSVAVGGPDGTGLLITSAREGYGLADLRAHPDAGRTHLTRLATAAAGD